MSISSDNETIRKFMKDCVDFFHNPDYKSVSRYMLNVWDGNKDLLDLVSENIAAFSLFGISVTRLVGGFYRLQIGDRWIQVTDDNILLGSSYKND